MLPSTISQPTSAPTGPKLRDSCDACASSKLKCHKQKPTCSRCKKRGIQCHYLATRRAGRRNDTRRPERRRSSLSLPLASPGPQLDQLDLQLDGWFATGTSAGPETLMDSGEDYFLGPTPALSTGSTASNPSSGLNSNYLSPVNYSGLMSDLDQYLQSPESGWIPDRSTTDMLGQRDTDFFSIPAALSTDNCKTPENVNSTTIQVAQPSSSNPSNVISEPQSNSSPGNETHVQISQGIGCCLMQAMGLLQQLLPQSRTASERACKNHNSDGVVLSQGGDRGPEIDAVISTNRTIMDTVEKMLQCSCSSGGYLLAILSLVAFKVMDSYATVVTSTPQIQSHHMFDEDPVYRAAQKVLREVHRVHRLVNLLSIKMKEQSVESGPGAPGNSTSEAKTGEASMPFSPLMLTHLKADMKNRLKALSADMVGHLGRD